MNTNNAKKLLYNIKQNAINSFEINGFLSANNFAGLKEVIKSHF